MWSSTSRVKPPFHSSFSTFSICGSFQSFPCPKEYSTYGILLNKICVCIPFYSHGSSLPLTHWVAPIQIYLSIDKHMGFEQSPIVFFNLVQTKEKEWNTNHPWFGSKDALYSLLPIWRIVYMQHFINTHNLKRGRGNSLMEFLHKKLINIL